VARARTRVPPAVAKDEIVCQLAAIDAHYRLHPVSDGRRVVVVRCEIRGHQLAVNS
jgi:hypothetical protein